MWCQRRFGEQGCDLIQFVCNEVEAGSGEEKPLPGTEDWESTCRALLFCVLLLMFRWERPLWTWLFSMGAERSWCSHVLKPFLCPALPRLPGGVFPTSPSQGIFIGGTMASASNLEKVPLPHLSWTATEQTPPHTPLLCGSPHLDSANPEKTEFRPKCPWVPLIKKKMAELMDVLGRAFALRKYCFRVNSASYANN